MTRPRLPSIVCALSACALSGACGGADRGSPDPPRRGSPNARWEVVETLRRDLEAGARPADLAGRAWVDAGPTTVVAGGSGRWEIVYEAGPEGVAEGGSVFLQVSPFWGWSPPQLRWPEAPGYTTVSTEAEGVDLRTDVPDGQLLAVTVTGRGLVRGERVRIDYGAGPAGARADRFAERGSRFWVAVDGDGDGVRRVLPDSPSVEVVAGPPARLHAALPSTVRPGQRFRLTLAVLDGAGNAGHPFAGELAVVDAAGGLDLPRAVRLEARHGGRRAVEGVARREGVHRVRILGPLGLEAESNPMVVSRETPRILWGDLQIHTNLSDGTGTPEDVLGYARDVAGLDVAALTDHDHWGMLKLDAHPPLWEEVRTRVREFNEPGRFVTLLGYEWTSWIHGHRHVLYPGESGDVLSSLDPAFDSPSELWEGLRSRGAMTVAHHTAGEPVAVDWSIPPDPDLETVVEVVSVHGSSEASDSPGTVRGAIPGHFARDALDRGYRLGFTGSGDGHDGHPGLAHLAAGGGGLAAVLSEDLTRGGVWEALRQRRVYATNGPRIVLDLNLDGRPMGSISRPTGRPSVLRLRVISPGPLERIDLVRSGVVVERIPCEAARDTAIVRQLSPLVAEEYVYVRVIGQDGGAAWSSPFFVE